MQYQFNDSDFKIIVHQLQQLLNESKNIPYASFFYLIGECCYGGHIADQWDKRTLNTFLSDYINEMVVNDTFYRFAETNECDYILPRRPERREIRQYISSNIPIDDSSFIYGLHEYTNAHLELIKSEKLIDTIISLPNESNQQINAHLDDVGVFDFFNDIQKRIPLPIDIDLLVKNELDDQFVPVDTALRQESKYLNGLLMEIKTTCEMSNQIFHSMYASVFSFIIKL